MQSISKFWRFQVLMLVLVPATTALPGCGLPSLTSGFGGSKPETTASTAAKLNEEQLLAAAQNTNAGAAASLDTGSINPGCPKFVVWPQENNYTVYEPGREGDGLAVMHRGEITQTKRECTIGAGQVAVRYGFSGRVLLGPRGRSGAVVLPLDVKVTDNSRTEIAKDALTVNTIVAVENPIGYFSAIRTITFPVPEGARPGDMEVRVGFQKETNKVGCRSANGLSHPIVLNPIKHWQRGMSGA